MLVGEAARSESLLLVTVHCLEMILCEADTYIGLELG